MLAPMIKENKENKKVLEDFIAGFVSTIKPTKFKLDGKLLSELRENWIVTNKRGICKKIGLSNDTRLTDLENKGHHLSMEELIKLIAFLNSILKEAGSDTLIKSEDLHLDNYIFDQFVYNKLFSKKDEHKEI